MVEETVAVIEKAKPELKHQVTVVILSALACWGTSRLVETTYEKLIIEGRLKTFLRRNK